MYAPAERPRHPFTDAMRKCMCFDEAFDAPMVRRALAAYFGLVTFLDDNIGRILRALEEDGPRGRDPRHLFLRSRRQPRHARHVGQIHDVRGIGGDTAHHGGRRTCPPGNVCAIPVTLADVFPTLRRREPACGPIPRDAGLPGHLALRDRAGRGAAAHDPVRVPRRRRAHRRVHDPARPLQVHPLRRACRRCCSTSRRTRASATTWAATRRSRQVVAECEAALRKIVDPEAVDRLARADQRAKIAEHGGNGSDPQEGHVPLFAAARGRSHLFLRISGRAP